MTPNHKGETNFMKHLTCSVFLVILSASLSWGQFPAMTLNYTHKEKLSWTNNIPNCSTGQNDCWHLVHGYAINLSAGGGAMYVANGGAALYNDYPQNTFTVETAMGSIQQIAVGSSSVIYALIPKSYCNSGFYGVYKWTGSAWVTGGANSTACSAHLSVAPDGSVCYLNPSGSPHCNLTGGTGWVTLSGSGYLDIAVAEAEMVYAITSTSHINQRNFSAGRGYN
jgi:hypothetical protein